MSSRIHWIDSLRGFSMILILWFHTEVYYAGQDIIPYHYYVQNALATFFFISGYLFFTEKNFSPLKKLKSLFRYIVWPYFFFTTLLVLPKAIGHGDSITIDLFFDIICGYASWFIAALIVAQILMILFLWLYGKHIILLAITAFITVIIACLIGNRAHPTAFFFEKDYWFFNEGLFAFSIMTLGYFYHRYENKINYNFKFSISNSQFIKTLLLILLFVLIKVIENKYYAQLVMGPLIVTHEHIFIIDILIGLMLVLYIFKNNSLPYKIIHLIRWTGKHSLIYYFFCGAVPMTVSVALNKAHFPYDGCYWHIPIAFIIVYIISTIIVAFFYKYLSFTVGRKN